MRRSRYLKPYHRTGLPSLQEELTELGKTTSAIRTRRACKIENRDGVAILKASPKAPIRFLVLAILLESQMKFHGLDELRTKSSSHFSSTCQIGDWPELPVIMIRVHVWWLGLPLSAK